MSPYAEELAHARLEALRQLIDAMRAAEDPAEKRRCAVAIFNAPDPCEIDDAIELEDDDNTRDHNDHDDTEIQRVPSVSESVDKPTHVSSQPATVTPAPTVALSNNHPAPISPRASTNISTTPALSRSPARPPPFLPASTTPAAALIAVAGSARSTRAFAHPITRSQSAPPAP